MTPPESQQSQETVASAVDNSVFLHSPPYSPMILDDSHRIDEKVEYEDESIVQLWKDHILLYGSITDAPKITRKEQWLSESHLNYFASQLNENRSNVIVLNSYAKEL